MFFAQNPSMLKWLCEVISERYGLPLEISLASDSLFSIALSGDDRSIELVRTCVWNSVHTMSCTKWDASQEGWFNPLGISLFAPGFEHLPIPLIAATSRGYRINYDILGLTYWMLTRQEEVGRTDLDDHGRFPATSSHAYKYGYLERPIVDEWLHILGQVIERTWPSIELKKHKFSIKVSHDVDRPSRYGFKSLSGLVRAMGGDVIHRRDFKSATLAPWIRMNSRMKLHPWDPANTFDWIMDLSEQQGLMSAFYFICGRTDPIFDADYEPEHPAIRALMRRIHERGHEIGLHPSYGSYKQPGQIKIEAERLRRIASEEGIIQSVWGGRMHYLRWEHPATMRALADAGMTYDSTLTYADRPGFRCGTCFEYPAFDHETGIALSLRVRPLVVMEDSVIAESYLGLGEGDAALKKFMQLKKSCMAVDGCFTLLWHNSYFENPRYKYLYESLLN